LIRKEKKDKDEAAFSGWAAQTQSSPRFKRTKIKGCSEEAPGLTTQQEMNLTEQDQRVCTMRMFFNLESKGMLQRGGKKQVMRVAFSYCTRANSPEEHETVQISK